MNRAEDQFVEFTSSAFYKAVETKLSAVQARSMPADSPLPGYSAGMG
jgi:hypothetical protein